jgi:hypothetical protein
MDDIITETCLDMVAKEESLVWIFRQVHIDSAQIAWFEKVLRAHPEADGWRGEYCQRGEGYPNACSTNADLMFWLSPFRHFNLLKP